MKNRHTPESILATIIGWTIIAVASVYIGYHLIFMPKVEKPIAIEQQEEERQEEVPSVPQQTPAIKPVNENKNKTRRVKVRPKRISEYRFAEGNSYSEKN